MFRNGAWGYNWGHPGVKDRLTIVMNWNNKRGATALRNDDIRLLVNLVSGVLLREIESWYDMGSADSAGSGLSWVGSTL